MEGWEEVEEDERSGRPSTSKTEENVEKIGEIVWKDQCLSIRMITEMVNMDKETVRQILHDQLNMMKVCAKMVPKNLTQEQKDNRKNNCSDIMERIIEQLDVLENVITCDEMWRSRNKEAIDALEDTHFTENEKSKNEQVKSEGNDDRFLQHQRHNMIEWVPEGQMVNQKYYLEVLTKL
jgi:hypothetical protein